MNLNRLMFLIFLFCSSISFAQKNDNPNISLLLKQWELVDFETVDSSSDKMIVTLTKYADKVRFNFSEDFYLQVVYSETKKEIYKWKFKRKFTIEITPLDINSFNKDIVGEFVIRDLSNIASIFLAHKGQPHNGIMLKLSEN